MRRLIFVVFMFAVIIAGCTTGETHRRLSEVDSLMRIGMLDSAYKSLMRIDCSSVNEDDKAYFDLLSTMAAYRLYKPITSDTVINRCVEFYTNSGDAMKLCEAYFYQGMIKQLLGKTGEAIVSLKQAEKVAERVNDMELDHKIYSGLMTVNYTTANYDIALRYARKELECSEKSRNKEWIAYAYNHISCVYEKTGQHDSAVYYIKKVVPYIKSVPKEVQAYHLSNIGLYYLHSGDTVKAKKFLADSYRAKPLPDTSNLLARILFAEGKPEEAMSLWSEVLGKCDLQGRIKIKETMAELLYAAGRYKESGGISAEVKMMKDSLAEMQQTNKVQELQLEYDHQVAAESKNRTIMYLQIALAVLVVIILAVVVYYRLNFNRRSYSTQLLISEYKRKIAELEASGRSKAEEVEELKRQMADAEAKKTDVLVCGRILYDSILRGETTVKWNKASFISFLEYYKVVNPDIFATFDKDYTNLSPANMFFLVLQEMNYDNEAICRILGFSTGAMRAARFRIKNKMKK